MAQLSSFCHRTEYLKELYIYIYTRSTKSRDYIVHSSSFLVQFVIFRNAFTFGHWCHYELTVTVSWCYKITWEWWFRMHFIHAEDYIYIEEAHCKSFYLNKIDSLRLFAYDFHTNGLGKGMNPSFLFPNMIKYQNRKDSLALVR